MAETLNAITCSRQHTIICLFCWHRVFRFVLLYMNSIVQLNCQHHMMQYPFSALLLCNWVFTCLELSSFSCVCLGVTVSWDKLCCYRSIFNVTTQEQECSCVWNGSLSAPYHVTASLAYVCAKVVSATETHLLLHGLDVIDSWAEGPLASSLFIYFFH